MGIYDREYYRREGSLIEAFAIRGQITKWIIIANAAVFILQLMTRGDYPDVGPFTSALDLDTDKVLHGQIWRLFTCAFLHDPWGWAHIVFNMWCLWLFGGDLEEVYGYREFLAFYLVAAVASSLAFLIWHTITGPAVGLGASGAITAVLILCALHFPHRTILLFMFIPIPIWVLAVFQVVQDTFGLFSGHGEVAFSAHLGGAAFGLLYFKQQWRMLNFLSAFRSLRLPRTRPRLRIYHEEQKQREPVSVSAASKSDIDEHFEAKVDAVLEKMGRHGKQSLTDAENEILLRASELYKKRRS